MEKNFVTYNSSAGSGKTFTLVKEYLKITLETDDPLQYRKILAITFTNKAAAEMKERILNALVQLSSTDAVDGTVKHLKEALLQPRTHGGLGIAPNQLRERSKKVLKSILHNYNDFGVSTIDKFTHKIIRTFAHDLQLPLNFNIELDEEEVLRSSIDMLITEVGNNEKLTKLLIDYAIQKSDDEKSWSVERDLLDFSKKLLKDEGELYLEKIRQLSISDFEHIKQQLYQQTKTFEKEVQLMGQKGIDFIQSLAIDPKSFSGGYFYKYWEDLKTFKKLVANNTVTKIVNGEKEWYAQKVAEDQKNLIDTNKQQLLELFKASTDYISKFESNYIVNKKLINNLYNLAVLNEIEKTLVDFKQENSILNISDFNKRIAKIVSTEPVPFIYERLGEKYQHYLIDEFQDTSIIQWHNLLPLVDNSLANGKFNMVVGDAKQAIYRFRGGEVEQIINFPKIYKHSNNSLLLEREQTLERNYKEESLQTNYRSKVEIVDFNNRLFQSVSDNLPEQYQKIYANLKQTYQQSNTGGGVAIKFIEANTNSEYIAENLNYIVDYIQQSLEDGYRYSDIAVLTRGRGKGNEVAAHLLNNRIPVISAESLLLISSKEVQFLVDLLRFLSQPADKSFQVSVLGYLTQKYNDDLYEVVSSIQNENWLLGYMSRKKIQLSFRQIANYSLYELVEHLMVVFELNRDVNVYVQFFLDKIHEYAAKKDNSILNFIEWWDVKSDKFSIVIPEGVNAVQVMTIHKSKGLEFPIVIYPFADSSVEINDDFFWSKDTGVEKLDAAIIPMSKDLMKTKFATKYEQEIEKSLLDLVNLLYVAVTRPKDRLYIVSKISNDKTGRKRSINGSIPDFLYDYCEQSENTESSNCFKFGAFQQYNQINEVGDENESFNRINYNNWRNKIQISYQAPKVWNTENPETIGEYGTLVHHILSKIETFDQVKDTLNSFLLKGIITENELEEIAPALDRLFTFPEIKQLFENFDELKNERSILLPDGTTYQPDRVVVKNNTTYLIDYKTGEKETSHEKQINNYRNQLIKMGYSNVKAQLLYVKNGELVEV